MTIPGWCRAAAVAALAAVVSIYMVGINDGQTFAPIPQRAEDEAPAKCFQWSPEAKRVKLLDLPGCPNPPTLEDVVAAANAHVSGPDGIVGTDDDRTDTTGHLAIIIDLLKQAYPRAAFVPERADPWVFNHAAGVLGEMRVLYTDLNEYLAIFGAPLAIGGYSGNWDMRIFDFSIHGTHQNFFLGNDTRRIFTPEGSRIHAEPDTVRGRLSAELPPHTQKGYHCPDGCWMLEYGHGNVLRSLYSAVILPTLFLSDDWSSFGNTVASYTLGVLGSIPRNLGWT